MNIPKDRKYTNEHEWAKEDNGHWLVGVTYFAQEQLGDITLVELPQVGETVEAGEVLGTVDSVKTFSDLFSPFSGVVKAVNESVLTSPELLNDDPYENGWLVRIESVGETVDMMDADDYADFVESLV